jgi:hypothetical protein
VIRNLGPVAQVKRRPTVTFRSDPNLSSSSDHPRKVVFRSLRPRFRTHSSPTITMNSDTHPSAAMSNPNTDDVQLEARRVVNRAFLPPLANKICVHVD